MSKKHCTALFILYSHNEGNRLGVYIAETVTESTSTCIVNVRIEILRRASRICNVTLMPVDVTYLTSRVSINFMRPE